VTHEPATLALDASGIRFGYVVRYPDGKTLHGEYEDPMNMVTAVDLLLQNGFRWKVLLATPAVEHVSGALWYLAAQYGADFSEHPLPEGTTDGQLRTASLWRRGMSAANRAARLLMPEGTTE
jgi:hypothetical protein